MPAGLVRSYGGVVDLTLPPPTDDATDDAPPGDGAEQDDSFDAVPAAMAGGVAALIARGIGVDVLWVRVAFVLLTLVGGVGIVVYAGLWLALVVGPDLGWSVVGAIGGAVVVAGVPLVMLVGGVQAVTGWPAVVLLLAGLALALWQPRTATVARPPTPERAARTARLPRPLIERPVRAPRPARERSVLGRAALGAAIVVAAAGALIDDANGGRFHPEQWLGAAALVCGAGLLVGTVAGRGRWLVVPAALFAAGGFVGGEIARLGIGVADLAGDEWVSIYPDGPIDQRIETGVGDVHVSYYPEHGALQGEHTVVARAAFGDVYVDVGRGDVEVVVRTRTDRGEVWFDGERVDGEVTLNEGAGGDGRLVVDAWVGVGDVRIYQAFTGDEFPVEVATLPPVLGDPGDPALSGDLVAVDAYLSATSDGWIVIGQGEAVIDPDDAVVSGTTYDPDGTGGTMISTSFGEFRLLPRSLLMTPDGRVVDLQQIREGLLATPVVSALPPPFDTVPPSTFGTLP
jgi:phage shock protein PspC (stress-responsive transcriptional regulator)